MGSESLAHVLLISFPGQGHVNPLLRLGKRLASKGLLVTFSTPEITGRQMKKSGSVFDEPTPVGDGYIRFEFFEDGWDDDEPRRQDLDQYLPQLELVGKKLIPEMIKRNAEQGRPISCLINNPFIPWVSDVAASLGLPSAMLWVQSCACFSAYYHYYHGLVPFPSEENPEIDVQLPCMPLLKYDEVPSFLYPTTPYPFLRRAILGQYGNLDKPFCILMESFQELEPEIIEYISKLCPIKPQATLIGVYVSFGSVVYLKQDQWDEIAYGLLNSGVSFLWVMKPPHKDSGYEVLVLPEGFLEKAGDKGKHSHLECRWWLSLNGDQVTDAKYLVDVFNVGVRMCRGEAENKLITRDEVEKCLLEATVGPKAAQVKQNALKWKEAADAAVAEGGSSDRNIQAFVDEVRKRSVEITSKSSRSQINELEDLVDKPSSNGKAQVLVESSA
ncbi:hypothetical protein GH714_013786 [Hevea brasiliensis]|uniref:Glycosyltransferase N-terminal domain-containing protein n=1 Tax=Hevea brasiliensis TaxID=3981 RepID=A0A6A6KZX8_HEVBR|nr:hypothetical protein GH714_013786 [Hevea brasiliensis]